MPLIRPGMPKPPPGFEVVAAKLEEFEEQMKLATQEESRGVVGVTTRPRTDGATRGASTRKRDRDADDADDADTATAPPAESEAGASATTAVVDESHPVKEEPEEAVPPLWRMAAINRARTRHVFLAYYKLHSISKEVFDYCVETQLIDGGLARMWRLPGYERLCCTACGVPGAASLAANVASKYALRDKQERRLSTSASQRRIDDTATCICRVPASQRKDKNFVACAVCGCRGCCSADVAAPTAETSAETEKSKRST